MADPCIAANQAFIDYYTASQNTNCNLDNQKIENRDEYCTKCIPKYDSLLSASASACGANLETNIAHNYDFVRFAKQYFCSKDASTGDYCDQVSYKGFNYQIPYSEWDDSLCKSSCVGQIDKGIREVSANTNLLNVYNIKTDLFTGSANPVSSCKGAASTTKGAKTNSTETNDNTSGANILSAQICLLSLIICLIMAYLK